MKLHRPYIPIAIRVAVAERQCLEIGIQPGENWSYWPQGKRLRILLDKLFGEKKIQLHHRPALCNRPWVEELDDYDPPANASAFLVYVPNADHDIETRVRGLGAQRSDLGQRRYNKKIAKNRSKDKKRSSRWPKRKLRSKPINARWRRKRSGNGWRHP